ncbi:D-alanyl-D-alanine carboxypeptidase family protein [Patescibacteria group bacterium]|nr:D-alanyl-D-alanine carboxypeptidase family protein [Patescibacteria group bacterium]MBU2036492.1 D-alanyl-D-alanine carboxypeptidase family protein [Patescibacteria group bacterium]
MLQASKNKNPITIKDQFLSLEKRMVKYKDLVQVQVRDNNEEFVALDNSTIPNGYLKEMSDMEKLFGPRVIVRKSVAKKLDHAQKLLQDRHSGLTLYVTYGYRSLKIQTERFLKILSGINNSFFPNPLDLYEKAHRFVAVPTVAGHPTGGAIDIAIKHIKTGSFLDFGSKQYNYSTKDCYVFTPNITKVQKSNRMLLRNTLIEAGFTPFDGEWWHFSYGDREWAFYNKKEQAIYSQLNLEEVKLMD